jgi:hypothetical protein
VCLSRPLPIRAFFNSFSTASRLTLAASSRIPVDRSPRAAAGRGVRISAVRRPPSVHGTGDYGFVAALIDVARAPLPLLATARIDGPRYTAWRAFKPTLRGSWIVPSKNGSPSARQVDSREIPVSRSSLDPSQSSVETSSGPGGKRTRSG